MERTLVIIKPDAVERGLIGEIISKYEKKGLAISAMKMMQADSTVLRAHYSDHVNKDFYSELESFMMSGPIVVMIVEGTNAIKAVREINGKTNPLEADIGSIRGTYANSITKNIVHGSDSIENAEKEIGIWFK